jgi:N-methylhydantoinase A
VGRSGAVWRVAVDIGGTFTDVVIQDSIEGRVRHLKVPSDPERIGRAAVTGIQRILRVENVEVVDVDRICHGTTVTTNAVIQLNGARTGILTTRGFRDVLEIGRLRRPAELLYGIHLDRNPVLVPRRFRLEIDERLDYRGETIIALDEKSARAAIGALLELGVEAIAVCLLFAYLDPSHERRLRELIEEADSGVYVALSSDIAPEWREYERTSTTATAAFVGPLLRRYLQEMTNDLTDAGLSATLHIMQSSGGLSSPALAIANPATSLVSGPAAGVQAAAALAQLVGVDSVISADMGGTSCDIGLVIGGEIQVTVDRQVSGHPVQLPMVDVEAIGAGGGSIAWVDEAKSLRVGPRSAGANPGPACYGAGGAEPAVTDADLVLGYLDPEYFAGGEVTLHPELAKAALESLRSGDSLDAVGTAAAIWAIVNANMAGAIRLVTIQRGHDPRDFMLVAFGGAGPVHAAALAKELSIPWVLIPTAPGVTSAFGLLVSNIRHDYVNTSPVLLSLAEPRSIEQALFALEQAGHRDLEVDGLKPESRRLHRFADLRYAGQGYVVTIPLPRVDEAVLRDELERGFHRRHYELYGFMVEGEPIELVNLRMVATGVLDKPAPQPLPLVGSDPSAAWIGRRPAFSFEDGGRYVDHQVYERSKLAPGNVVTGPAIVQQRDTTILIPHSFVGTVESFGGLIIGANQWNASTSADKAPQQSVVRAESRTIPAVT